MLKQHEDIDDDLEVREQHANEEENVTMWSITHDEEDDDDDDDNQNMITFSVILLLRAFGAPRGSVPMVQYYDSQLRSSLPSLLTRRLVARLLRLRHSQR